MPIVSYAQNYEDVVLARVFGNRSHGFYIDVGAWHPVLDSVTYLFYRQGWRGVNIEPLPAQVALLESERPEDINLELGLAGEPGERILFEDMTAPGLSTFIPSQAARLQALGHELRERPRTVTTLAEVCAEYAREEIDFLKIDVEGAEGDVLRGADWDRWRPRVLIVESTEPELYTEVHQRWEALVLQADYSFVLFDGLNRFFLREEDNELRQGFDRPACVLDDFVPYQHLREVEDLRGRIAKLEALVSEQQERAAEYVESLRQALADKERELEALRR